jgi:hypothetical protein
MKLLLLLLLSFITGYTTTLACTMLKWETGILTPGDSLMSETLAE